MQPPLASPTPPCNNHHSFALPRPLKLYLPPTPPLSQTLPHSAHNTSFASQGSCVKQADTAGTHWRFQHLRSAIWTLLQHAVSSLMSARLRVGPSVEHWRQQTCKRALSSVAEAAIERQVWRAHIYRARAYRVGCALSAWVGMHAKQTHSLGADVRAVHAWQLAATCRAFGMLRVVGERQTSFLWSERRPLQQLAAAAARMELAKMGESAQQVKHLAQSEDAIDQSTLVGAVAVESNCAKSSNAVTCFEAVPIASRCTRGPIDTEESAVSAVAEGQVTASPPQSVLELVALGEIASTGDMRGKTESEAGGTAEHSGDMESRRLLLASLGESRRELPSSLPRAPLPPPLSYAEARCVLQRHPLDNSAVCQLLASAAL